VTVRRWSEPDDVSVRRRLLRNDVGSDRIPDRYGGRGRVADRLVAADRSLCRVNVYHSHHIVILVMDGWVIRLLPFSTSAWPLRSVVGVPLRYYICKGSPANRSCQIVLCERTQSARLTAPILRGGDLKRTSPTGNRVHARFLSAVSVDAVRRARSRHLRDGRVSRITRSRVAERLDGPSLYVTRATTLCNVRLSRLGGIVFARPH